MKNFLLPLLVFASLQTFAQINLPSYIPVDGLVGWWPFTGNANDLSGNDNNGLPVNATLTTDRFGNTNAAYNFNGYNSRIEVPAAPSLNTRKVTVSAWVRTNISQPRQVIYKATMNADYEMYSLNEQSFAFKQNSNCVSGFGWQGGIFSDTLHIGQWEHIAATYDGDTLRLYKNGVVDSVKYIPGLIDSCDGGGLRFGYNHLRWFASTGDPFNGKIDDIGIWNRALTSTEITGLFAASYTDCGYGNMGINVCNPQRNFHIKDVLRLEPRTTAPANAGEGDIYYDSTLHKLRVYDGTQWQDCW